MFALDRSLFNDFTIFDYREGNIIFWSGLISAVTLYDRKRANRNFYLKFYLSALIILFLTLNLGLGAKFKNIFDDSDIIPVFLLITFAGVSAFIFSDRLSSIAAPSRSAILFAGTAFLILMVVTVKFTYYFNTADNSSGLYSKNEAIELLQKNTPKDAVIFTAARIDINGIRKPFFDWTYSWYNLYSLTETETIAAKLKAMGIDIVSDKLAYKRCSGLNWIFRTRCHRIQGKVDQRLNEFEWRSQWAKLTALEPNLSYVLLNKKSLRDQDRVIATKGDYALIKM